MFITPQVIQEGYDRQTCWVQARVGSFPDGKAILTTQKLLLSGSDIFFGIHSRLSHDGGQTWDVMQANSGLERRPLAPELDICPCDGTASWHVASQTMLLTGHIAVYRGNALARPYQHFTFYSHYDVPSGTWSNWDVLGLPSEDGLLPSSGSGCGQRYDLPNGEILLPVYGPGQPASKDYCVAILRCQFKNKKLEFLEAGSSLTTVGGRGFVEPSVTCHEGTFYLTLRNDFKGHVTVSQDGLNYSVPRPWCWDDGTEIGNYNTQQHWLRGGGNLYLVYTRRGADNDHVFRHRAPLFIAQVDTERLCLLRDTEQIAVPEKGARLGNFGVTHVSDQESWIVAAEWMQTNPPNAHDSTVCERYGANNRIWLSKVLF